MQYFFTAAALLSLCSGAYAQAAAYAQCGGTGFTGSTTCVSGYTCTYSSEYYSQCLPGAAATATTTAASAATTAATTATSTAAGYTSTTTPAAGSGKVKFAGINISGFDFGCDTSGDCTEAGAYPPLTQYYGPDGYGQMTHFVNDDTFNLFRLPVGWQYLTNNAESGTLNATTLAEYNTLVQDCLGLGAHCIVDIHNYARFNGAIIGQGGPANTIFASLWSSIATYYADQPNIIFGVMNEPHDLNVTEWATSVQAAVTAIRNAGATTQYILLPGDQYTSAATIYSDGSGAALLGVTNPDGTKTNLVFDVHKYSDSDNSGTSATCVTNNIDTAFAPLADWLRTNDRQAFNTEFGGGNNAGCVTYMQEQLAYLNTNSDVYLGWTGWAAGSFAGQDYVLSMVPTNTSGVWTDTMLVADALVPAFKG